MRTIHVTRLHRDGLLEGPRTPVEVLDHGAYLDGYGLVPPRQVMNDVFRSGGPPNDGIAFAPFEVDEAEWREIASAMEARGDRWLEPPAWVETAADWRIWALEVTRGVPSDEHRRLAEASDRAEAALKAAIEAGEDRARIEELHWKFVRAGQPLADFLNRHLLADGDDGADPGLA